jgi:pentatricopeptide repeat protein
MERAASIIDEMVLAGVVPNERSYTTLMEGYARVGEIGKSFQYFNRIKDEGLNVDVISYGSLLKACCKAGRMQNAIAVTKEMTSAGFPMNNFIYNILLDGWAQRGDMWEASDIMQQMRQQGFAPDIHSYTSFVNACCKAGDMQKAMETMEQMKQMGVQPNLRTYTTLIHGWASASYPEKALACYDEMKAAGLKPDKALFHCIMTSLLSRAAVARETVFDGVLRVTSEMVDLGICVDLATVRHWQKYLVKAERWSGDLTEAVERIFPPGNDCREQNEMVKSHAVSICCRFMLVHDW